MGLWSGAHSARMKICVLTHGRSDGGRGWTWGQSYVGTLHTWTLPYQGCPGTHAQMQTVNVTSPSCYWKNKTNRGQLLVLYYQYICLLLKCYSFIHTKIHLQGFNNDVHNLRLNIYWANWFIYSVQLLQRSTVCESFKNSPSFQNYWSYNLYSMFKGNPRCARNLQPHKNTCKIICFLLLQDFDQHYHKYKRDFSHFCTRLMTFIWHILLNPHEQLVC